MDHKERIIQVAEEMFMRYGIRSITMDEIAKELSISKKTIYQHFKDKDDIVLQVGKKVFADEQTQITKCEATAENVIHELFLMSQSVREHIANANPSVLYDLQKYYPEAWQEYQQFKQFCLHKILSVLQRGIDKGYFWDDMHPEIMARLRTEEIELVFNQAIFPRERFDAKEVQMQLLEHFIRGILTHKGLTLYQQYTEKLTTL